MAINQIDLDPQTKTDLKLQNGVCKLCATSETAKGTFQLIQMPIKERTGSHGIKRTMVRKGKTVCYDENEDGTTAKLVSPTGTCFHFRRRSS